MKNVQVHFVTGDFEPENNRFRFADIPQVGDFITELDSGNNSQNLWFEVIAVVHLAIGENSDFDPTNPNEFVAVIWVKKGVEPNEAVEKFSM